MKKLTITRLHKCVHPFRVGHVTVLLTKHNHTPVIGEVILIKIKISCVCRIWHLLGFAEAMVHRNLTNLYKLSFLKDIDQERDYGICS